jgi:hypothetical protein
VNQLSKPKQAGILYSEGIGKQASSIENQRPLGPIGKVYQILKKTG